MSDKDDYIVNYECKRCKVKYQGFYKDEKSKQFVKDHANHEDNECQRCSKAFHSIAQLMAHLRAAHGLKEYQCDICPFMTPFKKQIQVHKSTKHQVKERFLCKKCGTDLASYAKLVRHKCDDEKLPGLCQYCGYESKNKRTLRWHVRMYHTERPYTCPICNKNVVNEVGLILHMRFHENPRPKSEKFLCDNCGKKFKLKTALRNHMKTHTGEKSYSCSLCDRKFAKRETLRQHLLTHTGKRPYTCDICGKSFVQKPGLTSHRRSHPGKLPPMPRVSIDSYILEVDPSMVHAVKNPGPKLKTNTGNFLNRPEKSE